MPTIEYTVKLLSADVTGALGYTPANKAGETFTGAVTLAGAPTVPLHAATKAYVDAIAGTDLLPLANVWTGTTNDFGTPVAGTQLVSTDFMRFTVADGNLWIKQTNQPAGVRGEVIALAADTYHNAGSGQLANASFHAYSSGTHSGNVWGVVTEAWNESTKTGGKTTQLFGAEFAVINAIKDSSASRHAGVLIVFKNRLDTANTPAANGLPVDGLGNPTTAIPTAGQSYTKNTHAILIDCGGGRNRSGIDAFGNVDIECGWNKGIYFGYDSLDTTDRGATKAIGIDFTALDASAPEGGGVKYYDRCSSLLAIPDNGKITLSTNLSDSILKFNATTGVTGFYQGTSLRAGVNMSTGKFEASGGIALTGSITTPIDLTGVSSNVAVSMAGGQMLKFASASGLGGLYTWKPNLGAFVPVVAGTIAIKVDGTTVYLLAATLPAS